eukprot:TRINITY_DN13611_c0_g1_i1.p1 TRINITY_DN13611_c0_g1~~TRINITY_DN13611_c0_g1_i1.p1  ORF type:complete len:197 (+),score=10.32 TRINITY_DN13611_c0_g1_i1:146-736(+)
MRDKIGGAISNYIESADLCTMEGPKKATLKNWISNLFRLQRNTITAASIEQIQKSLNALPYNPAAKRLSRQDTHSRFAISLKTYNMKTSENHIKDKAAIIDQYKRKIIKRRTPSIFNRRYSSLNGNRKMVKLLLPEVIKTNKHGSLKYLMRSIVKSESLFSKLRAKHRNGSLMEMGSEHLGRKVRIVLPSITSGVS